MKKIILVLVALSSSISFASEFDCIATITEGGKSQIVALVGSEAEGGYIANATGLAFGAQIDLFEEVGLFKIFILDQNNGRISASYSGPAPVRGERPVTLSSSTKDLNIKIVCSAI